MPSLLLRIVRYARTIFSLGGSPYRIAKLTWHVLRTEGVSGVAWRLRNARNLSGGRVDPWQQFFLDGGGKQPFPVKRFAQLWSGQDESLLADLQALLQGMPEGAAPKTAVWTLARWHARHAQWPEAEQVLRPAMQACRNPLQTIPLGIKLLWADTLTRQAKYQECAEFLAAARVAQPAWDESMDLQLAQANLLQLRAGAQGDAPQAWVGMWLQAVNEGLQRKSLAPVRLTDASLAPAMNNLCTSDCPVAEDGPLVSVIVPAYNAASTLPIALHSLRSQSWRSLEVLIVDDCSTDDTAAVAESFARQDARFRLIRLPRNQGAYHARNMGAHHARGAFITVHDSDDWSHAQKIEIQVRVLLEQPQRLMSFSHWSRASESLLFGGWNSSENWATWVPSNISSLMMRRAGFERLGYWDCVSCAADTEYYHRALRVFGAGSVVDALPGVALSFGLTAAGSLTQQSASHIFTIFGGVRKQYEEAFHAWHRQYDPKDRRSLYLERNPEQRPFPAPEGMLVKPRTRNPQ